MYLAFIHIGRYDIKARRHLACVQNGITQLEDWRMETWQLALRARCHVSIRQSPSLCNGILNTCPCLLAILSMIQYVGLCVSNSPISFVMIEKIYTLCLIIIIKSEVWTITHCLGLGHETMVCAVCHSVFLWICDMAGLLCVTFVSWWYLARIWLSATDMHHNYHARYPTDDWHLAYIFSLEYFSVEVCLVGVFPYVRVYAPLTLASPSRENEIRTEGDPALHLIQARGHLNWRMGLPVLLGGNLGFWIVKCSLILYSLWGVS